MVISSSSLAAHTGSKQRFRGFIVVCMLALAALGCAPPAVAADSRASKCSPVQGLPDLRAIRFLFFGEIHGTKEVPEFFGDVVCTLSRDRDLVVALELDIQGQSATDAYLMSRGSNADVRKLLDSPAWRSAFQDGRTSQAMLELVDRLRRLGVKIVHFKPSSASPQLSPDYYAVRMAGNLTDIADAHPNSLILGLMGNVHIRKAPMDIGSLRLAPAASHLPAHDVLSFDADGSGEAWNCWGNDDCGVHPVTGNKATARLVKRVVGREGVDGTFSVGKLYTASPPANDIEGK